MGHPEHSGERPAELEDRGSHGRAEWAEPQDPAEDIRSCPGHEEGDQYLHGEIDADRDQVTEQSRKAKCAGLPVEGQRSTQRAVGIPQGQQSVVHLGPGQVGPGDDLPNQVGGLRVVGGGGVGVSRKAEPGELVERAQCQAVEQRRRHDHTGGHDDPGQTQHVGKTRSARDVTLILPAGSRRNRPGPERRRHASTPGGTPPPTERGRRRCRLRIGGTTTRAITVAPASTIPALKAAGQ